MSFTQRRVLLAVLALVLLAAAGTAVFAAGLIDWLACEEETSEACERHELARFQYAVAVAGLIPALVLAGALVTRRRRTALVAVAVAVAFYAIWGILADAAVHGWDDLKLVPF